ncbi:UNVERIFIED_CONTAM: hypothetical protein Sindi_2813800, partial [Sesamum indicum]
FERLVQPIGNGHVGRCDHASAFQWRKAGESLGVGAGSEPSSATLYLFTRWRRAALWCCVRGPGGVGCLGNLRPTLGPRRVLWCWGVEGLGVECTRDEEREEGKCWCVVQ